MKYRGLRYVGVFLTTLVMMITSSTSSFWRISQPLAANAADESGKIDDRDITIAVRAELLVDRVVPHDGIAVKVEDGIVTLDGSVETLLVMDRAVNIVETIRGVLGIVNRIQVVPGHDPSDDEINRRVKTALQADPATGDFDVRVSSRSGTVTLSGKVDSHQEKTLSELITKGVEGVRNITNNLVAVHRPRQDDDIEADIVRRWESDPWIDESLLGLMVEKGAVSLTGTVGSLDEKRRAIRDAWVDGVKAVEATALNIRWWAYNRMRRSPADQQRSDEQIREALHMALKYDARTKRSPIDIAVSDRIVTLSGVVQSLDGKRAAGSDAENITGVRRVSNNLEVSRVVNSPDPDIQRMVKEALLEDLFLQDATSIDVQSNAGTVSLSGTVHSLFDKVRAETLTARTPGVLAVKNDLNSLSPLTEKRDVLIHRRIQEGIKRNPYLYNENITVGVEDGIATLVGHVHSLAESRLATEKAYEGGALMVRNHLELTGRPVSQAGE